VCILTVTTSRYALYSVPQLESMQPVHILLVEGERMHVRLLMAACSKNTPPCSLHVVADASGAVQFLTGEGAPGQPLAPAAIFVNFRLDQFTHAADVVARIRERKELAGIPVVVLSAVDDPEDLSWTARFANTRVLVKGYDFEVFARDVRAAIPTFQPSTYRCGS
jgi:CheY-like chemotaxis protein